MLGRLITSLRRSSGWLIGSSLVLAVVVAIAVGFVGAPKRTEFDWQLMAVAGTAFGTLALAAYTAGLATTTRREVGLAIEEQRARDRPIVVVSVEDVGGIMVETDVSKVAPTLLVALRNVGLAPALDVRIHALHGGERSKNEVIAVIPVDHESERAISLSALTQPSDGFRVEDLGVAGTFTDRHQRERIEIVVLNEAGLRDEQREGARRTSRRAWPYYNMLERLQPNVDDFERFRSQVRNTGAALARDVVLRLVTADGNDFSEPRLIGEVPSDRHGASPEFELRLPIPHPDLRWRITWRDDEQDGDRTDANVTFPGLKGNA